MAFSDTISATVFNTRRVMDSAFRRCKMPAQTITSEHIDIAKDQLYLLLSSLANDGAPLWCVEKQIYALYEGVSALALDVGTVDVLSANLRSLQPQSGTETVTATEYEQALDGAVLVTSVGILWSAASVPIAIEKSTDGVSWSTIQSETPTAAADEWSWFDLSPAPTTAYIRVRATSGTLSTTQVYFGNMPSEIPIARINRNDYDSLPDKTAQSSRPVQYWFDRQVRQPIMHLWPVPNAAAITQQVVIRRHRHIMDVGTLAQEIEVPQRWLDATIAMLAAKLSREVVEVDAAIIPQLDADAAAALARAQNEERDNSPIRIAPNIGPYTK